MEAKLTEIGREMHALLAELYPICRSITGNGFRKTLQILRKYVPLEQHEVPSGTRVFDWTIPHEWNIQDAYIKNSSGERVVDFARSNLHVLNYSVPVRKVLPLRELRPHLYTLPDKPDLIPYRTSYYQENWGFCLTQRQLDAMPEGDYEVCIDSSLEPGHLTYGELYLPGETSDEILFSCHACHPSLCNDNLSGIAVETFLAMQLAQKPHRVFSYRFLYIPGTIGSITWLARNEEKVSRIRHGVTLACLGDSGPMTYKRSRRGDAAIDRAANKVLKDRGEPFSELDFSPYGYDERQFCSPGFNLPVGCLSRTPHGKFAQYHTSADNLDFVRAEALAQSLAVATEICEVLESNTNYVNLIPKCEPQLGKRGLYAAIGGYNDAAQMDVAMLWVLNFSDGEHDLLDIAERSALPFQVIKRAADLLLEHRLLAEPSSNRSLNSAELEFVRSGSSHR
jgi:aminopeptidase-like protein